MKRKSEDKLEQKRQQFAERTKALFPDIDVPDLFRGKPALAIRVNPLKSDKHYDNPIDWAPSCYWADMPRQELTALAEFATGEVFLQNASSFIPPIVLQPQEGDRILDMCAAPGGKASHVAAISKNGSELWVNDNSRPRLLRMQQNFERLGVRTHQVTMLTVDRIGRELPHECFDRILIDAPCSGEGALQWNSPKSFTYWSTAQIKRLQKQQKQALRAAWQLLKPGGQLVYSTCTMAPEENEAVIDWLLRKNDDAIIVPIELDIPERVQSVTEWQGKEFSAAVAGCVRIKPSSRMEAFFVAKIQKSTELQ